MSGFGPEDKGGGLPVPKALGPLGAIDGTDMFGAGDGPKLVEDAGLIGGPWVGGGNGPSGPDGNGAAFILLDPAGGIPGLLGMPAPVGMPGPLGANPEPVGGKAGLLGGMPEPLGAKLEPLGGRPPGLKLLEPTGIVPGPPGACVPHAGGVDGPGFVCEASGNGDGVPFGIPAAWPCGTVVLDTTRPSLELLLLHPASATPAKTSTLQPFHALLPMSLSSYP